MNISECKTKTQTKFSPMAAISYPTSKPDTNCYKILDTFNPKKSGGNINQGTLTEGEGSVQLISSLRYLVL